MTERALVSICIPTYNQTVFLTKTLNAIVKQSYKNFEVIVTDDSTNDDVKNLVEKYQREFKIIYVRNTPSLGSPANWNKALDLAQGDLIKMMHHDDWFEREEALEVFVQSFEKNKEVSFVFCISKILNVEQNTFSYNTPGDCFISDLVKNPFILFNKNKVGSPTATMFKKTALRFDEQIKYVVDVDFYIAFLKQHKGFHFIKEALIVNTSYHQGQVTASSFNANIQIGEYAYLYNKLFGNKIPNYELSKFFFFLFRQYPITQLKSILEFNRPILEPKWYFALLLNLSKISIFFKKVKKKAI